MRLSFSLPDEKVIERELEVSLELRMFRESILRSVRVCKLGMPLEGVP